jgi:urease accessory protein
MHINLRLISRRATLLGAALLPVMAQAHTGHDHGYAFESGLLHPLGGLDHLLAMLMVGLWASRASGWQTLMLPLVFLASLVAGASLASPAWPVAAVEAGIAASVVLLGLVMAFALRLPPLIAAVLTAGFALCHGLAHGLEAPAPGVPMAYIAGFALSSTLLLTVGVALGRLLATPRTQPLLRFAGAGVAACGVLLFF